MRPDVRRRHQSSGNLLSALDRRCVAGVVLNRDMGPIARLPSLGELPAAVLDALPAPRTPLDVADVQHSVGLPGARMQHALLCMAAAADGGMSMLMTVSLQHVQDAMQQQRMHAPGQWEESAKRWLRVESVLPPIRWAWRICGGWWCWKGRSIGPVFGWKQGDWSWLSSPRAGSGGSSAGAQAATGCFGSASGSWGQCAGHTGARPRTSRRRRRSSWRSRDRQRPWPIARSNMWQAQHAAAMCRALQGHAAALPRAPAAQSSSNRPAASLALLHSVLRAWCWALAALEPHSSALRLYDRGEGTVLTVRLAVLEALHLSALSGDGGEALYLQGTVAGAAATRFRRQSGGDALRLVMAENMGPWLRAFSTSRWKVEGDREKFADAWRRWVEEQFPVGGMLHLPQPPSVLPVRHRGRCGIPGRGGEAGPESSAQTAAQEEPPCLSMAPMPTFGTCCSTSAVTWPQSSVGRRRSTSAPGLAWMGLVTVHGELASTAGPPTSTPRTCWTTSFGTMRLIRRNGTSPTCSFGSGTLELPK